MTAEPVMGWLRANKPWLFQRGSASIMSHEVEKILAVIEAMEALLAEENERIHDEAYNAAMEDKMYGSD